jgi:hypothetical protein
MIPDVVRPPMTETLIEQALKDSHGDLFIAASALGHVSTYTLDRMIRSSAHLQNVFTAIREVKASEVYDRMSREQVEQSVVRRLTLYRSDALTAIHDLAMMEVSPNPMQNQVKLAAAQRLAGSPEVASGSDFAQTLAALNEDYHRHAPRIKSVRERVIEFEQPEHPPIEGSRV